MSQLMGVKAPKPDPEAERLRREAEAQAKREEEIAAATAAERKRAVALGFRGTNSLINAPTSAGFASKSTLGG